MQLNCASDLTPRHIQDNVGGGPVLGQCSRRKERLERVASTGRASTKGRSEGLQLFLCVVGGCVCSVICVQVRTAKSAVLYKWYVLCV